MKADLSSTGAPRLRGFLILCALVCGTVLRAQPVGVACDRPTGVYATGQSVQFTVARGASPAEAAPLTVKVLRNNRDAVLTETIPGGEARQAVELKAPADGWYFCSATPEGEKKPAATTGVVVNPEVFRSSVPEPEDFDAFWAAQKARLKVEPAAPKLEALTPDQRQFETRNPDHLKKITNLETAGYRCENLEIPCLDVKPARAYFATPKSPRAKGHPAILFLRAAGVEGGWCRSSLVNALGLSEQFDALVVDLNAHGMLNGQPQDYYDALAKGELANYQNQGKESRESFYFLGMFLRLQRALDFLATRPEWDGRNLICIGISQGGAQALAAAGLDARVSVVVATVPAMCDIAGKIAGAPEGWPGLGGASLDDPQTKRHADTVRYFDAANFCARSNAATIVTVGLVDTSCPPPGVYAAFNRLRPEKRIIPVPDKGHHALSSPTRELRIQHDDFIRTHIRGG